MIASMYASRTGWYRRRAALVAWPLVFLVFVPACRDGGECAERAPAHVSTGFREPCHPSHFDRGASTSVVCCSDDPAAPGGAPPRFDAVGVGPPGAMTPLFAGPNNDEAEFGLCEFKRSSPSTSVIPGSSCPIPCNPLWSQARIDDVCVLSSGPVCLQHVEVRPEDCIFVDGLWRPIRGTDVAAPEDWVVDEPGTRQDPELERCRAYATGGAGTIDSARLRDCVDQLTSADQRGFCGSTGPGDHPVPDDPCADMNEQ